MKKCIKVLAVVATIVSICGVLFFYKDSIKKLLNMVKEKFAKDDFDDFDDDDFDEDEIFGTSSDREYVNIDITNNKEAEEEADDDEAEEVSEDE